MAIDAQVQVNSEAQAHQILNVVHTLFLLTRVCISFIPQILSFAI